MSERVYGLWAGNPNGHREDPERCIAALHDRYTPGGAQCRFKRGKGSDGNLCGTHARVEARSGRRALAVPGER